MEKEKQEGKWKRPLWYNGSTFLDTLKTQLYGCNSEQWHMGLQSGG